MNIFQELKLRWRSESPAIFNKIKKAAILIGSAALSIITANTTFGLSLAPTLITILGYIVAGCAGIAGVSQITVKN